MITQNILIWKSLIRLAIVFGIAAIAEFILFYWFNPSDVLMLKIQGIIGVLLVAYFFRTAYIVWQLSNYPFSDKDETDQ